MAGSRLVSFVTAAAAALMACGCGAKQQLRSAVAGATPAGLEKIECDYSDEGGGFPDYFCLYRTNASLTVVALAIARRLQNDGFTASCDSAIHDAIDVRSFRGDVRVFAHVEPQAAGGVRLEISGTKASQLARDLIDDSARCSQARARHLGNAPCVAGWNANGRARALARELAIRPKVVVWGGPRGCRFYFLSQQGFVLVDGSWRGERLSRLTHRPLYRWEEDERRAYSRSAGMRAGAGGFVHEPPAESYRHEEAAGGLNPWPHRSRSE